MQVIVPCRGQWRHWATFLTRVESPVILQWVWRKVSWRGRDVERNQRITDSRSVARHNLGWDQNWCSHLPLYHRHASFDILSILFLFQIKYFLIHGCLNLGDTPSSCPELQLLVWDSYNFHQKYLYDFIKNILHHCNDDLYSLLGMCQCQLKAAHPSCIKWWDICQNLHNITCPLTCSKTDDGAGAGYRRPVNIPIYYLKLYPKHNDRHITQTTRSETHP